MRQESFQGDFRPRDKALDEDLLRSSTRMTPRLADKDSGLMTQGYSTRRAIATGSSSMGKRQKRGQRMPVSDRICRIRYLLRAAATASTGLCGNPSADEAIAARITPSSSAATTPPMG